MEKVKLLSNKAECCLRTEAWEDAVCHVVVVVFTKPLTRNIAIKGSNPGLADRVPGRPATHTLEPRLGQDGAASLALVIDTTHAKSLLRRAGWG